MHFESRFTVSGTPQAVIDSFADVPLMASFLPGASVEPQAEDGSYPATLVASFGPKRLAFKGALRNSVDREALRGALSGQASADVRGARMALTMTYSLSPAIASAAATKTEVLLASDAQLTGVLAEFAKAGGVIVAEALVAEFARRFSAHMEQGAAPSEAAPTSAATLSMATILVAMLRRFRQWLWRTA
jgi:carbon monoxide dehydrogenase subunit G